MDSLIKGWELRVLLIGAIVILGLTTVLVAGGAIDDTERPIPNASDVVFEESFVDRDDIPRQPARGDIVVQPYKSEADDAYAIDRRRYLDGSSEETGTVLYYTDYVEVEDGDDELTITVQDHTDPNADGSGPVIYIATIDDPIEELETGYIEGRIITDATSSSERQGEYVIDFTVVDIDEDREQITTRVDVQNEPEDEWSPSDDEGIIGTVTGVATGSVESVTGAVSWIASIFASALGWVVWFFLTVGVLALMLLNWAYIFVITLGDILVYIMTFMAWLITGWIDVINWFYDVHNLIGVFMSIGLVGYGIIAGSISIRLIRHFRSMIRL